MPLTPAEQEEMDRLELEQLEAEAASSQQATPPQSAPAPSLMNQDIPVPLFGVSVPYSAVNAAKNMGLEGGGAAGGQALGALTGPLAPAAVPLFGGIGSFIGNSVGQLTTPGKEFSWPEAGGAFVSGTVPGGSLAKAGGKALLKEGGVNAIGNLAAAQTESALAGRGLVSPMEAATATGSGFASPFLGAGVGKLTGAKGPVRTDGDTLNSARLDSWRKLAKEGVVVPPSQAERGSDILNSLAGPADLNKQASLNNQFAWQKLGREQLGLEKSVAPIMPEDFTNVRKRADVVEPYETLKEISENAQKRLDSVKKSSLTEIGGHGLAVQENDPALKKLMAPLLAQAAADVDALKIQRNVTQKAYDQFRNGDASAYERWQAALGKQEELNTRLIDAAESVGDKDLVKRLNASRKLIAQSYALEAATDKYTGHVNPIALAAHGRAGVPLTDNLDAMAAFASSYAKDAVGAAKLGAPGANNLSSLMSMGMFSQGTAPGLIAGAASKLAGRPTRSLLLSSPMQRYYMRDQMETGLPDFAEQLARFSAMSAGRPTKKN